VRYLPGLLLYTLSRTLLFICLALVALPSIAGPLLTPHTAEYKIEISIVNGKLTTQFETTESGYFADSVIEATGLSRLIARGSIREKSWFSESYGTIRPHQYRSADTISSDKDVIDLDFDWKSREVTGLINGEDFRNYLLQDAEELKRLSISNVGTKAVKVPYGRFNAVGIQHHREGSSRVTTLWCVEELGYLPVVIEQHRKGKLRLRAVLTKYEPIASRS
jgi:hypothetical protein